jgi:hypothetical protein
MAKSPGLQRAAGLPPKRWYERWTTYVVGTTALGIAIIGFADMGQKFVDKGREILYGAGFGISPYEKAAKDATDMLATFPMPLITSPKCSFLAVQGQQLRGVVASMGNIRAVERRADETSDPTERALSFGTLQTVFAVRDDVKKWHEEVVKEGCIESK